MNLWWMVIFNMKKSRGKQIVNIKKSRRPKYIIFNSTRSNIKKTIETSNYNLEKLKKNIGEIKVSEFFKVVANKPKYEKLFKVLGNEKMSDFLDNNRELFLEILKRDIM